MKLLFFNEFNLGVLKPESNQVVDVSAVTSGLPNLTPQDLIMAVITEFEQLQHSIANLASTAEGVPLESVRIRPPIPFPRNIVCMAVNYIDTYAPEATPIDAFNKSPNCIIGDGDVMDLSSAPTASVIHGEAELALVIGRHAANVTEQDAMDYVFGYTNFIDGSARGLGRGFYQGKSRRSFAPIGPFLVTADEFGDPHSKNVRLYNNGVLKQDFNTSSMAHKIPECIALISSAHDLEPGDVIATGTHHAGLDPFMDGDRVELETEGLGRLHITVKDDLKRTWDR